MIKRTLYFGNDCYLHTKDEQLVVKFPEEEKQELFEGIKKSGGFLVGIDQQLTNWNYYGKNPKNIENFRSTELLIGEKL